MLFSFLLVSTGINFYFSTHIVSFAEFEPALKRLSLKRSNAGFHARPNLINQVNDPIDKGKKLFVVVIKGIHEHVELPKQQSQRVYFLRRWAHNGA